MSKRRSNRRRRKRRQRPSRSPDAHDRPRFSQVFIVVVTAVAVDVAWGAWVIREFRRFGHLHLNPVSLTFSAFFTAWAAWLVWRRFHHDA